MLDGLCCIYLMRSKFGQSAWVRIQHAMSHAIMFLKVFFSFAECESQTLPLFLCQTNLWSLSLSLSPSLSLSLSLSPMCMMYNRPCLGARHDSKGIYTLGNWALIPTILVCRNRKVICVNQAFEALSHTYRARWRSFIKVMSVCSNDIVVVDDWHGMTKHR